MLERSHKDSLELYGADNRMRLTGKHETSSFESFSWGDGNRGGSLRIPVCTKLEGKGYLEDRRPAANLDPYLVASSIVDVVCLNRKYIEELQEIYKESKLP